MLDGVENLREFLFKIKYGDVEALNELYDKFKIEIKVTYNRRIRKKYKGSYYEDYIGEVNMRVFKAFNSIKNTRRNSIAFLGQVGSGKTHLSIAIGLNLLAKKIPVVYMSYREQILKLKQNILDEEYYSCCINKLKTSKVLIIDDLFKGKTSESDINIMFEIINYRYMNNLPIIVSSEFFSENLLHFDEGIGSRILEMCKDYTVEIKGDENNYRIK